MAGIAVKGQAELARRNRPERRNVRFPSRPEHADGVVSLSSVDNGRQKKEELNAIRVGQRFQPLDASRRGRFDLVVDERMRIGNVGEVHQALEIRHQVPEDEVAHLRPGRPEFAELGQPEADSLCAIETEVGRRKRQVAGAHQVIRGVIAANVGAHPLPRTQHEHHDVRPRALTKQASQPVVPVVVARVFDHEPSRLPLRRESVAEVLEFHVFVEQRVSHDQDGAARC